MSSNPSAVEKKLLHYTGKAIADFNMIQRNDKVMVCLSDGKDSFTMFTILDLLRRRSGNKFEIFAFTLDQAQPGWDDFALKQWLNERLIPALENPKVPSNMLHALQGIKPSQL